MRSRPVTRSRSRSSASTDRSRSCRQTSCSSAKLRSSSTNSAKRAASGKKQESFVLKCPWHEPGRCRPCLRGDDSRESLLHTLGMRDAAVNARTSERRESIERRRRSALYLIDVQREHEFPALEPLCFPGGVFEVDVVGDRQAHVHLRQLMDRPVDTLHAGGLHVIDRVTSQ